MQSYLKTDSWKIIEEGFDPDKHLLSESIFSLGNGFMGQRANFEEKYTGDSLQGSYMAGVYYPDKTIVGWWKIGYPEYFAKVLNSTNWIGIDISIDGEELDLAKCEVKEFRRILDMKEGHLSRNFLLELSSGKILEVRSQRFLSMKRGEIAAIKYSLKAVNFSGYIEMTPYLDGDIINQDANYGEKFWKEVSAAVNKNEASLEMKTKKLDFQICSNMRYDIEIAGEENNHLIEQVEKIREEKYVANRISFNLEQGKQATLYKYIANTSSRYHDAEDLVKVSKELSKTAHELGFNTLLEEQKEFWKEKWKNSDIVIEGDIAAQQGIRFNIFQLYQTYTGEDERLNIGPKGFTGEKYGGSTYWDTEAYCLPFYLSTAEESVARNLLIYRYRHLEKAIENAEKLGFANGAALYPMVTMNGEESHNEWEITFEEIHRNGAIAYAIYNYVNYTGDKSYLGEYGLEVLVAICRFWEQRVSISPKRNKYVILGVTGPNEYENNINNNWYTNRIAVWTLEYTLEVLEYLRNEEKERLDELIQELSLSSEELVKWQDIIENMYFPIDKETGIFLQQDNYLDKEQVLVEELDEKHLPLNQNWSWDRILRSCFIKQADVLQGLYFLEDKYDLETIEKNYRFYEPRTVHESSLSPCIHAVLAAKIKDYEKAYQMYIRTARLDLDNYNNDTEDGCHITSMAGTWMSFVQGFGGLRVRDDQLILNPFLPDKWKAYSFKVLFRGALLKVELNHEGLKIYNQSKEDIIVNIYAKEYNLAKEETLEI
ncbi:glycoside hydrolase family 65 protein [Natronospora cellulosivora (SeqCode)]